jgi:large subunit ribosomal protein L2
MKTKNIKSLKTILKKHSGRSLGRVTVRGQGGRHKRYYREIDFRREKYGVEAEVVAKEYDPNRNVDIALLKYIDGEYRYILSPASLKVGEKLVSGEKVEAKAGNAMKLGNITIGTLIHNVELVPGRGGVLARSAGVSIQILAKEGGFVHLKMPSGEVRIVPQDALATIGSLGNEELKKRIIGTVRGVAQDPDSHPHGGGEGRSGVGRKKPMTKYGRPAVGNTRNKKKWTSIYILKRRK